MCSTPMRLSAVTLVCLALRKYSTLALRHMLALRHKLALRLKLALRHKLARRHKLALRRKLVTANTSYPECWP